MQLHWCRKALCRAFGNIRKWSWFRLRRIRGDSRLRPDPTESKLIEALAHEQYTRVEHCQTRNACPQERYTQGLIALFQSRERALASFQQVRTMTPNSRLATSSVSWIELLQANSGGLSLSNSQNAGWAPVIEDFVWETLEREHGNANENARRLFSARAKQFGIVANRPPVPSQDRATLARDKDQGAAAQDKDQGPTTREKNQETVQNLQRQLQERERIIAERDRRLEVMSSQLDDLKRIELNTPDRRRPVHPPATVTP